MLQSPLLIWYGLHAQALREGRFGSSIDTYDAAMMIKGPWFQEVRHRQ
jgi:hypothetical protein